MQRQPGHIAGVRTERNGSVLFVDAQSLDLSPGDRVTVEMQGSGSEWEAVVAVAPHHLLNPGDARPAGKVLRLISPYTAR
ncbi:MAG: hypothetical protein WD208_09235 [Dehalococcoidia bacterium]